MNALTGNDYPVSAEDSMLALSTTEMEKFNQRYGSTAITKDCQSNGDKVTKNGIYHYSWMGNQQATNALDVVESTFVTLESQLIKPEKNDGALPLCSGRYGQIIGQDYRYNHFDEVNHFFGMIGVFAQDPVTLYRQHVNRLKLQGL